jgi:hypothetical protein
MKRTAILAIVFGLGLVGMGGETALAQVGQTFTDGCPSDRLYNANYYVGTGVALGYSDVHIGRVGCPWFISDVWQAWGHTLSFNGEWAYSPPTSATECNGAKLSYVAAKQVNSNTYTVVGFGNSTGQWVNWFGNQFCLWNVTSGTSLTTVNNSPDGYYRILLRAWEANGTERIPAGNMWVDTTPIP